MKNVLRYYRERPELVEKNRRIEESGRCPFCPEGLKSEGFQIVGETTSWTIASSQFPYRGSDVHLLVLPKRHVITSLDLTSWEWEQWPEILRIATTEFPFLTTGFGLAMRENVLCGVTLYHLHFHLIVPKANAEGGAEVPVNFAIG